MDLISEWNIDKTGYLINTSTLKTGMYVILTTDEGGNKFQTKMLIK